MNFADGAKMRVGRGLVSRRAIHLMTEIKKIFLVKIS